MSISLQEFKSAINTISPFVLKTELVNYKKNIFLKKESAQITGSFKWRGVLYSVMNKFEQLKNMDINEDKPFFLVTQSTGNHGIAVIYGVQQIKKYYCMKYPSEQKKWKNIYPCIFGNVHITKSKFDKISELLEKDNKSVFDCSSKNYGEALKKRELFLQNNQGIYMSHGGKDIMTGYGSLAEEIITQVPKDKSVTMITAIGAGGPIGLAAYFNYFPNFNLVVSQTENFDAFVRSLQSKEIEYNHCDSYPGVSDGIAVDKPEEYALNTAINLNVPGISVNDTCVKKLQKNTGLGGSTCIALAGLEKISTESDIIVILDCEGNYKECNTIQKKY